MTEPERGFKGFSSLVSDLSDLPSHVPQKEAQPEPKSTPVSAPFVAPTVEKKPSSKGLSPRLVMGIVIVGAIALLAFAFRDFYTGAEAPGSVGLATTSSGAAGTYNQSVSVPSGSSPANRDVEELPPKGEGHVLSDTQLRYCLAQDIRLNGANRAINATSQVEVDRYNALVDDYNARCAKAKYRKNSMSPVKSGVEARRALLESQGEALVKSPVRLR